VDRCALFVDASYVLADGAMAVHGTRRGESVSWDYEGLLQLLSDLARERTGLPVLRCYWYEATVDGRRTAEQDTLADIPGIKLRVAKIRPGRREGVETEIHRDLTTLARNSAVSDALVVSAEEDLVQVIADVQDLGMRVTLVHIAVDGNWTISRSLRQESDDIIEVASEQLRPFVELIVGAEPAPADEPDDADHGAGRPAAANGHSAVAGVGSYQPPAIYTAPVVAEYQRPAPQLPRAAAREERTRDAREERTRDAREAREERTRDAREAREERGREAREERTRDERPREDRSARESVNGEAQQPSRPDIYAATAPPASPRTRQDRPERQERPDRQERPEPVPAARVTRVPEDVTGYAGPQDVTGYAGPQGGPDSLAGAEATQAPPGQLRRLPSRSSGPGSIGPIPPPPGQHAAPHGGQGSPRSAPYSGPQPVVTSPPPGYPSAGGVSLGEAVQAAHEEGQEFGASVARDAPALWLEAVLARKPRMPSDLEARLLQGSALPIDFLLHDEVRHALRRGFWDALERTRR
jgi:NYN domain